MELRTQHIRCLYKTLFFILLCFTISSCTEQYAFKTSTYENILVVQANITNEYKKQEIKISRSYRFEESGPTIEEGATVYVTDNDNNTYSFSLEKISGLYVSNNEFQSSNLEEYWEALKGGENLIRETPIERWDSTLHYSPIKSEEDKT
ncbi:DUF4249 family protein, partial [Flavobacterium hydatis]|uniref:DUF4249 family protein n=1 Tax=Flavobacterium hydatis TaxID=991 RepID=UPI003395CB83